MQLLLFSYDENGNIIKEINCKITAAPQPISICNKKYKLLRSVSNILAGEFRFASSDRGEISHHHLTIVDLSVGVAWSSQGMVG